MKRSTFQSPYIQHRKHIGKPFTIVNMLTTESGKLYNIVFADGVNIEAWPEEIYKGQGWEPLILN